MRRIILLLSVAGIGARCEALPMIAYEAMMRVTRDDVRAGYAGLFIHYPASRGYGGRVGVAFERNPTARRILMMDIPSSWAAKRPIRIKDYVVASDPKTNPPTPLSYELNTYYSFRIESTFESPYSVESAMYVDDNLIGYQNVVLNPEQPGEVYWEMLDSNSVVVTSNVSVAPAAPALTSLLQFYWWPTDTSDERNCSDAGFAFDSRGGVFECAVDWFRLSGSFGDDHIDNFNTFDSTYWTNPQVEDPYTFIEPKYGELILRKFGVCIHRPVKVYWPE